jgi:hypothetical protein
MINGWYYLHTNGELIYKYENNDSVAADIRESDFARVLWAFDSSNREIAWNILVEAESLGANKSCIESLAARWGCDNEDGKIYAKRIGVRLNMDGNKWCAHLPSFINIQESPVGFGDNVLNALASLCKELGYEGGKMWNPEFKDLIKGAK